MITIQTIQEQLSSPEGVAIVTDWLQKNKQQGRRALARHLCQALDLNDAHTGKPRLAGVQKALRVLESQGYWQLPKNQAAPQKQWNPRRLDQTVPLPQGVPPRVEAVTGLHMVEVTSRDDALFRLWNELILPPYPYPLLQPTPLLSQPILLQPTGGFVRDGVFQQPFLETEIDMVLT